MLNHVGTCRGDARREVGLQVYIVVSGIFPKNNVFNFSITIIILETVEL